MRREWGGEATRRESRATPLTALDAALLLLLSAFLIALCTVRSSPRLPWADELLGMRVIGASSLAGTIRGWWFGADGGGLLYYFSARLWTDLFSIRPLSVRLLSTAGMLTGLVLTWTAARRYFPVWIVAISSTLVFLLPVGMRWQEVNGRFYGAFFASAAFASLCFLVTADGDVRRRWVAATAGAHLCLIGSHILGLIYSFSLIAGMIALDGYKRRRRPALYASAAAAWILVPISYHAIRSSALVGKSFFWTKKPPLHDLLNGFFGYSELLLRLASGLLLLAFARGIYVRIRRPAALPSILPGSSVVFLCGSLVFAQGVIFLKSRFGTSIYADRYLLPVSVATILVFASCLSAAVPPRWSSLRAGGWGAAISSAVLVSCCVFAWSQRDLDVIYPHRGLVQEIAKGIPPGAPVLVTAMPSYMLLSRFDPTHRYYFLLDWKYDSEPKHADINTSGELLMQNWERAGYDTDRILPCSQTFARNPRLYVLVEPRRAGWFKDRLLHDPAYQVEHVSDFPDWVPLALWSVQRKPGGELPC